SGPSQYVKRDLIQEATGRDPARSLAPAARDVKAARLAQHPVQELARRGEERLAPFVGAVEDQRTGGHAAGGAALQVPLHLRFREPLVALAAGEERGRQDGLRV